MAIYGYARVSTRDQTLASQEAQLRSVGCTKIYAEKVSGGCWPRSRGGKRMALGKIQKSFASITPVRRVIFITALILRAPCWAYVRLR
jgi:DNA invertase Pin-like site-specific DNA recombinase